MTLDEYVIQRNIERTKLIEIWLNNGKKEEDYQAIIQHDKETDEYICEYVTSNYYILQENGMTEKTFMTWIFGIYLFTLYVLYFLKQEKPKCPGKKRIN